MTSSACILLALAGAVAVVDWWAVARRIPRVDYVAKPLALGLLICVAATLDPDIPSMRAWFIVALAFSLAGDVFLMLPQDLFVQGLGSFLVAHIAYVVGFAVGGLDQTVLLIAGPLVAIAVVFYARLLMHGMTGEKAAMKLPVSLYAVAIGAMLSAALAFGSAVAIVGASLFVISDGLIGYSRFLRGPRWAPVAIIVTYHLGQAGLVLGLVHT